MFGLRAMFVLVGLAVALTAASPMENFNKFGNLKPVNTLEETYDDPDFTTIAPTEATTDAPTDAPTTTPSDAPTTTSGSSAVYWSLVLVISSLFLL